MSQPKLTVGLATHTDYIGVANTIQHLRLTNRRLSEMEIIVVDNSIGSQLPLTQAHSRDLKNFMGSIRREGELAGIKLVEMPESEGFGTTQPRNRVFSEATGEWRFCIDGHVLFEVGAFDRLLEWCEAHPDCQDLLQGPILHDNLNVMATGFADEWRDEMWGIWELNTKALHHNGPSVESLPSLVRQELTASIEPFEIESQGLWFFGCRADAWLGFNPHFRGFGGEEWYIHRKYRKAGHKCLCLPFMRGWHNFGRPGGISYTISTDHKVRNYILGHRELGDSLAGIHQQFVVSKKLSQERWDWLKTDPENNVPPQSVPQMIRAQGQEARPNNAVSQAIHPLSSLTVDNLFDLVKSTPRDLNEHMDTLKLWASKVKHVTEFSERKESTIAFLAGRPVGDDPRREFTFRSYNTDQDPLIIRGGPLHTALSQEANDNAVTTFTQTVGDSIEVPSIDETDILFIDTKHNGTRLSAELLKHGNKVRRAIIVHDTAGWLPMVANQGWGEKGDDGGPGLNEALRNWVDNNPEWFVAYFTPNQYGLTIISKHLDDKPREPVNAWLPGWGPGTEIHKILKAVDINPAAGCDCNAKAAQMDIWGPTGCEEHFDEIVGWFRDGEERWGWKDKWEAAAKMMLTDPMLAISLNPTDPFPGLIRAAISRAKKEQKRRIKDSRKKARLAS